MSQDCLPVNPPVQEERIAPEERMLSATRALCNTCGQLTEARVVTRAGEIWLVKWCGEHGRSETLVSTDEAWYRASLGYVKPATPTLARWGTERAPCPTACGLCPAHEQHTCLPILEITDACNMDCPICLVDAGASRAPGGAGKGLGDPHLSLEEIQQRIDKLVEYEGRINMITLSGGEPTLHPELLKIVDLLQRKEFGVVSLSTNGLRLAQDPALLKALREREVVISLQYDGTTPATYAALRGDAGLAATKQRILDALLAEGIRISLTMTLARGINEGEVPALLDLLFAHDAIVSLMVQPLSFSARTLRGNLGDPARPITVPEVVALLADGSRGILNRSDITPLPCSHPSCFALTYLLKALDGSFVPLGRVLPEDVYLDTIKNQALLNTDPESLHRVQEALFTLWSSSGIVPHRDAVLKTIRQLLLDLNRLGNKAGHREVLKVGVERIKSIFIHHFMDRYTFDLSRVARCCNHYPESEGRLLPACVRNNPLP